VGDMQGVREVLVDLDFAFHDFKQAKKKNFQFFEKL